MKLAERRDPVPRQERPGGDIQIGLSDLAGPWVALRIGWRSALIATLIAYAAGSLIPLGLVAYFAYGHLDGLEASGATWREWALYGLPTVVVVTVVLIAWLRIRDWCDDWAHAFAKRRPETYPFDLRVDDWPRYTIMRRDGQSHDAAVIALRPYLRAKALGSPPRSLPTPPATR